MSSTDRQNKILAAEDWKRVYQSFRNADFQSYDFDNLRRSMIGYLRENYPEDFNDYIESSEYLALIDMIAFLGQNLAFRFDLNARDNFLELAERRESVLRLARLLSYNPKRNQPANGLLKFTAVTSTESIVDSNGRDIANRTVVWNDTANPNWYEQFIKVINAALSETGQFGSPIDTASINGVPTQQYRFNATNTEVPVYTFTKNVDGRNMTFEIVSSGLRNDNEICEEAPLPGKSPAFLYRDDSGGTASTNTGFFMHFRQGTLQESTFGIVRPSTAEVVDIDAVNINNSDLWLYGLDSLGFEEQLWSKVDAVEGSNIIYNSIAKDVKKIYSVLTKTGDRARLIFSDGVFGDLPQGNFKIYYRTSNALSYTINPTNIKNVTIDIPYLSRVGKQETLTISLGLFYTVDNAAESESSESIKQNAPAVYYTQNRMITGEDYNVLPLSVSQDIVKIKSINRVSSGISRYFDLKDSSGKYSNTNLFAQDGLLYKEDTLKSFTFTYSSKSDVENIVSSLVEPRIAERAFLNFYLDKYPVVNLTDPIVTFTQQTAESNMSTGYFADNVGMKKIGSYTSSLMKYLAPNAMVKFVPPTGKLFSTTGKLINAAGAPASAKSYIWTKLVKVVGDGTNNNTGILNSGYGPVFLNDVIPSGAILSAAIPKFVTGLEESIFSRVVDSIFSNRNFGLRYSADDAAWKFITESNINTRSDFSLSRAGDKSSQQLDSSWFMILETDGEKYTVTLRGTQFVFESESEVRFFYDDTDRVYDITTGSIVKDKVVVLGVNSAPNSAVAIGKDLEWEVVGEYINTNGYVDNNKVLISFYDTDDDGIIDDPERFSLITSNNDFIYSLKTITSTGDIEYSFIDSGAIEQYNTLVNVNLSALDNGQLLHIKEDNSVKQVNALDPSAPYLIDRSDITASAGRSKLRFQYIHAASESSRIDPSATNIIDVYLLTKSYDTRYRQWLRGDLTEKPMPLTSDEMYISYGQSLNQLKAISDEVVYHPVKYKNLFGRTADSSVQAIFKVVKNSSEVVSDNDIKTGVIESINEFFDIDNWDFGDSFYFTELATYIMNKMIGKIVNIVIVPRQPTLVFGNLYEIKSKSDEIFISSALVDDVEIISEITESRINASSTLIV